MVKLDGGPAVAEQETVPREEQVEDCLVDLVEVARIKTLDDLGDGLVAFDRTRRWLAMKAQVCPADVCPRDGETRNRSSWASLWPWVEGRQIEPRQPLAGAVAIVQTYSNVKIVCAWIVSHDVAVSRVVARS